MLGVGEGPGGWRGFIGCFAPGGTLAVKTELEEQFAEKCQTMQFGWVRGFRSGGSRAGEGLK